MLRIASATVLAPLVLFCVVYGGWPLVILIAVAVILSMVEWTRIARHSSHTIIRWILGTIYILGCFAALIYTALLMPAGYILCLMLCVWASDIGAYFAGKTIGGPKLVPAISPNKTWAGLIGGMVAAGLVMVAYTIWIGLYLTEATGRLMYVFPQTGKDVLFAFGAAIAVVGQVGDFIESWQKRQSGLKDSGNLIPGHGGILDRIDALLLAAPFYLIVAMLLLHG